MLDSDKNGIEIKFFLKGFEVKHVRKELLLLGLNGRSKSRGWENSRINGVPC